jgi:hypothetical protein
METIDVWKTEADQPSASMKNQGSEKGYRFLLEKAFLLNRPVARADRSAIQEEG